MRACIQNAELRYLTMTQKTWENAQDFLTELLETRVKQEGVRSESHLLAVRSNRPHRGCALLSSWSWVSCCRVLDVGSASQPLAQAQQAMHGMSPPHGPRLMTADLSLALGSSNASQPCMFSCRWGGTSTDKEEMMGDGQASDLQRFWVEDELTDDTLAG